MAKPKKRKVRVSFRRNNESKRREGDFTRQYQQQDGQPNDEAVSSESVRAKGALSRKRTVQLDEQGQLSIDEKGSIRGRVITPHGLYCLVADEEGKLHKCYTRRLIKSLQQDARNVLASGDWVRFRPAPGGEGLILRVEPRRQSLARAYRQHEQILAANVEQILIVCALAEPELKRNLIDRYLVSAGLGGLQPILCLNKVDLVDPWSLQPIVGLYAQLGYPIVLTSTHTGWGMIYLKRLLAGKETVIVGQSGVGKSSLLNALEPTFHLRIGEISASSQKGKHTTTSAQLLALPGGGSVIDTPGVRQFDVWKVESGDVERFFPEFRSFTSHCRYPGCLHLDELDCAIRSAVADRFISYSRYESYVRLCTQGANDRAAQEADEG
ncbi:ribosome small subunit-dependent GTPase A [bacterium]|nr:ribosome small subunit-dependent GTPase A [bacterium]